MKPVRYDSTTHSPLITDRDIEHRVADLIGFAIRRQLWLLFLDGHEVQLPLLVPVDGLPDRLREGEARALARAISEAVRAIDASSVVIVLEEPHGPSITNNDRAWAKLLHAACDEEDVRVRGVLLSHDGGVGWIPQDDYR